MRSSDIRAAIATGDLATAETLLGRPVGLRAEVRDGHLAFRLNTDELIVAGPDNPLRAGGEIETPAIYLAVRRGCEARLNRSTWQQLAEIALSEGDGRTVTSGRETFSLLPQ